MQDTTARTHRHYARVHIIGYPIKLGRKQRTIKSEIPSPTRSLRSSEKTADIKIISGRYGQIGQPYTGRSIGIGNHSHAHIILGKTKVVIIKPGLKLEFDIEFCARTLDVSAVVGIEKTISPAIDIDAKTRKLTPFGHRV